MVITSLHQDDKRRSLRPSNIRKDRRDPGPPIFANSDLSIATTRATPIPMTEAWRRISETSTVPIAALCDPSLTCWSIDVASRWTSPSPFQRTLTTFGERLRTRAPEAARGQTGAGNSLTSRSSNSSPGRRRSTSSRSLENHPIGHTTDKNTGLTRLAAVPYHGPAGR